MELLFVVLIAFAIGLGLRYVLPGRDTYGSVYIPSFGAIAASIVWAGLTWLGWKFDGGWIWVASLVVGGIVSLAMALIVPRVRRAQDERMLDRLSRA